MSCTNALTAVCIPIALSIYKHRKCYYYSYFFIRSPTTRTTVFFEYSPFTSLAATSLLSTDAKALLGSLHVQLTAGCQIASKSKVSDFGLI